MADGEQQQQQQQQQQNDKPWYDGKADAEMVGYWQNKAWDAKDPAAIALEATKAAREAQKFVGVPPEQLLRLPKDAKDEAGWNTVYTRLGKPKEAKEYDLSSVKFADGTAIADSFADMIRQTAYSNHLSKDAATAFANAVVKHMDEADKAEKAELTGRLDKQREALKKSWGTNMNMNELAAKQGAARLGVSQEVYDKMAEAAGVDFVAEMFRKIGATTKEDTFVEGGKGNGGNAPTVESAIARKNELMADAAWGKRYLAGGHAEVAEMNRLNEQISAAA